MNDNARYYQQATEQLARLQRLNKQQILDQLKEMDPALFEVLVAVLFVRRGYTAETVGQSGDEGVDIRLSKGGSRGIAQCKRYADSVGQPTVRDLYGTLLHNNADEAFLVTTAQITRQARDWAFGKPIRFVDGFTLVDWVLAEGEKPRRRWFFSGKSGRADAAVLGFAAGQGQTSKRPWLWPLIALGILLFGVAIGIATNRLSSRWDQAAETPGAEAKPALAEVDAANPTGTSVAEQDANEGEAVASADESDITPAPSATATQIPTATTENSETEEPSPTPPPTVPPTSTWTPEPPARGVTCSVPVDIEFEPFYDPAGLGCPVAETGLHWAAWETFERGYLLWRSDTDAAYAFFGLDQGSWMQVAERWDGTATVLRGEPPTGLRSPERGFGYIWGIRDDLFNGLGWATDEEKGFCALIQQFEQGFILQSIAVDSCTADNLFNHARSADWRPITLIATGQGQFELR